MSAPAVAVSETGSQFAAAWKDIHSGEPNVYWAIFDKLEPAMGRLVHEGTQGQQDHPSLCVDKKGTFWVAWEDNRDGRKDIWIRSSRDEDPGRRLTGSHKAEASFPTIAAGENLVAIVYESDLDNSRSVRFQLISTRH